MNKIFSRVSNWWENLVLEGKAVPNIMKWIVMPLIFLAICLPSILYFSVDGWSADGQHEWLTTISVVLGCVFVVAGIVWMLYSVIKEHLDIKKLHKKLEDK